MYRPSQFIDLHFEALGVVAGPLTARIFVFFLKFFELPLTHFLVLQNVYLRVVHAVARSSTVDMVVQESSMLLYVLENGINERVSLLFER